MNKYTLSRIKERLNKELYDSLRIYVTTHEPMEREENVLEASKRPKRYITESDIASLLESDIDFAFQLGILRADNKPKSTWISVKYDLPCNHKELISPEDKRDTKYVVALIHGYIVLSRMYKLDGKWHWENDEPTYWMLIPEPPKE